MKIKFRLMVRISITSFSRYFWKCHFFRFRVKIAILRKNFAISIKKEYSRDRTNPKPIIHTNFTHHTSFLLCFEDLNSKLEIFLNMDDMTHVPVIWLMTIWAKLRRLIFFFSRWHLYPAFNYRLNMTVMYEICLYSPRTTKYRFFFNWSYRACVALKFAIHYE